MGRDPFGASQTSKNTQYFEMSRLWEIKRRRSSNDIRRKGPRCKKGAGIIPEGTRCKNRHRRDLSSLMDENAEFTIQASEKYGSRGRRQAEKLVKDVEALYAGGELEERDMDAMMRALQDAYWRAKEINRTFVPKKYREEEE